MNVIDHGLDPQEAVDAPHFHHQWMPDEVFIEPMALSPDTRKMLTEMGYKITEQATWGTAAAILVMPEAVERTASPAAAEPRNPAASAKMKPGMNLRRQR